MTAKYLFVADMLPMGFNVILLHVESDFSLVMPCQEYHTIAVGDGSLASCLHSRIEHDEQGTSSVTPETIDTTGSSFDVTVAHGSDGRIDSQGILVQFDHDDVVVPRAGPLDALA